MGPIIGFQPFLVDRQAKSLSGRSRNTNELLFRSDCFWQDTPGLALSEFNQIQTKTVNGLDWVPVRHAQTSTTHMLDRVAVCLRGGHDAWKMAVRPPVTRERLGPCLSKARLFGVYFSVVGENDHITLMLGVLFFRQKMKSQNQACVERVPCKSIYLPHTSSLYSPILFFCHYYHKWLKGM